MSSVTLRDRIAQLAARLPADDLERLADALDAWNGGVLPKRPQLPRVGDAAAEGLRRVLRAWASDAPELPASGVALALRVAGAAAARERERRTRVVWTGPDTAASHRSTAGVVLELVRQAQQRLLFLSYASYAIPQLEEELEHAVDRGVSVVLVLETHVDSGEALSHDLAAHYAAKPGVNVLRWPIELRPEGAKLHAKAVVADGHRVLVTSANLTGAALRTNVELGLLAPDRGVATAIERHVERMRQLGQFVPLG